MEKPSETLTEEEFTILDKITVPAWDIVQANSGGHKCITNISGLNFFGRGKRPPQGKYKYDQNGEDPAYLKFTKMVQKEFARLLKEKIAQSGNDRYEPDFEVEMNEYGRSLKNARRQGQGLRFPKSAIRSNPMRFRPSNR